MTAPETTLDHVTRTTLLNSHMAVWVASGYRVVASPDAYTVDIGPRQSDGMSATAHILLTMLTLGLWLIVWLIMAMTQTLSSGPRATHRLHIDPYGQAVWMDLRRR